ncbi:hypothetical protein C0V78_02530 [Novosphingobium sp. TH158]|nr:hypothetical protein C0V78_02530 [Novosphingobium sp. TH158]
MTESSRSNVRELLTAGCPDAGLAHRGLAKTRDKAAEFEPAHAGKAQHQPTEDQRADKIARPGMNQAQFLGSGPGDGDRDREEQVVKPERIHRLVLTVSPLPSGAPCRCAMAGN